MTRPRGFTLIELLIAAALLGVLAVAVLPLAETATRRAKESELRAALREIRTGIDAYKRAWDDGRIGRREGETGYPPTLQVLAAGVVDTKSAAGHRIHFLRRVPRDPFAAPDLEAAQTWGLRSYRSPPDAPSPGADVYDVHSLAPGVGLNGIPYRQW